MPTNDEAPSSVTVSPERKAGPYFPKYFGEILIGFGVNIAAAVAYEQFKGSIPPQTLAVATVAFLTFANIFIVRHAFRSAEMEGDRRVAQAKQNAQEAAQLEITTAKKYIEHLEERIKTTESSTRQILQHSTEILHNYIHNARDMGVKLLPRNRSDRVAEDELLKPYKSDINNLLVLLSTLFKEMCSDGTNVWVALRVRKGDKYHTFCRTPNCHPHRTTHSAPLAEDSNIIRKLIQSFMEPGNGDCVLLTGPGKPEWQPLENDKFGENKSVLLGAVFSKDWNGEAFGKPVLSWILCVNADKENAFDTSHKPLMKCCNDVLSWLVNEFARLRQTPRAVAVGLQIQAGENEPLSPKNL